ncbi:MAG TPA: hypothetical protein ENI62_09715 [Gammaproteobacteria bacterium]|nr:hypothetical protein [Gammaproteobacteria bacterium]
MKMKHLFAVGCSTALLLVSAQSKAIPSFARANSLPCGACHSAFPALNEFGRAFKVRGYRITAVSQSSKKTDFSTQVNQFPISAAIYSRPFLKEKSGNTEVRAIHELELFAGGVLYQNLSGFMEIEAEGEDGFGGVLGSASLNFAVNDSLNFQVAYAPTFFADPYDTLADMRKLSVAHYALLNSAYGNADNGGILRHSRQQVSLFGRVADDRLFYNFGIGGLTEDNVANKSSITFGRLAFDIEPTIMVGAFGVSGTCKITMVSDFADCQGSTTDLSFSRVGVDTQMDFGALRLTGVYLTAKDDLVSSTQSESNSNAYVQAMYFGKAGDHTVVPMLRFESTQSNDGKDETKRMTLGATYYVLENLRATIEYANDTSVPAGESKGSSFAVQIHAAF